MKQVSISSESSKLDWTTKPVYIGAVLLLVQWGSLNRKSGNRLLQNGSYNFTVIALSWEKGSCGLWPPGEGVETQSLGTWLSSCAATMWGKSFVTLALAESFLFCSLFVFMLKKKYPVRHLASERHLALQPRERKDLICFSDGPETRKVYPYVQYFQLTYSTLGIL